jgi:hypothetical protein
MRIGGEVTSSGSGLAVMQVKIRRGCPFGVPLMTSPDVNLDPADGNAAEHITARHALVVFWSAANRHILSPRRRAAPMRVWLPLQTS